MTSAEMRRVDSFTSASGGERRRDHPFTAGAVAGKPLRERVLEVGQRQRVEPGRGAGSLPPQRLERGELLGRDLVRGEPPNRCQQFLAGVIQRVRRADGGGGRVVELVCQA